MRRDPTKQNPTNCAYCGRHVDKSEAVTTELGDHCTQAHADAHTAFRAERANRPAAEPAEAVAA